MAQRARLGLGRVRVRVLVLVLYREPARRIAAAMFGERPDSLTGSGVADACNEGRSDSRSDCVSTPEHSRVDGGPQMLVARAARQPAPPHLTGLTDKRISSQRRAIDPQSWGAGFGHRADRHEVPVSEGSKLAASEFDQGWRTTRCGNEPDFAGILAWHLDHSTDVSI